MPSFRPGWSVWVARTGGEVRHEISDESPALPRGPIQVDTAPMASPRRPSRWRCIQRCRDDARQRQLWVVRRSPVPVTGPRHRPTGRCEFSARPVGLTPSHEAPRGMQRATGASSGAKGASPVRTAAPNTSQNDRCEREFGCPQDFLSSPSRSLSVDIEVRLYNKRAEGKHCRP